jgi:hypothetical protein
LEIIEYSSDDLKAFSDYEWALKHIFELFNRMDKGAISNYWQEEITGFDYMFSANPVIIRSLREHCHHITGIRSYDYRAHHNHKAGRYLRKLRRLMEIDSHDLFISESPLLGGFGYKTKFGMVNLDTLKFYESLIALSASGCLFSLPENPCVLEIGSGWGGFAYQYKSLFPKATYICVDLPATMIFSLTYLKNTFPDAIFCVGLDQFVAENLGEYDFVFLTPDELLQSVLNVDLVLNMVSFQEMSSANVEGYCNWVKENNAQWFYSHNRDKSSHNNQLSSVSKIIGQFFPEVKQLMVLEDDYTQLVQAKKSSPWLKLFQSKKLNHLNRYKHLIVEVKYN